MIQKQKKTSKTAGRISRDERKQFEYMFVSLINTFMIAAIQGGVYPIEANWAADRALSRLARIGHISEIPDIAVSAAQELCEMSAEAKRKNTGNPHVENARHYISAHLSQKLTADEIAAAAGISKYHLCRLFRKHTGMRMREYVMKERIETARRLLETGDDPIPRIAAVLGFCDQSHFTAVFRKYTGTTPRAVRKIVHERAIG